MKKKTDSHDPSVEDVLALNVPPAKYAQLFEAPPPKHLGIALCLLIPGPANNDEGLYYVRRFSGLVNPIRALLEYDRFREEFISTDVDKVMLMGHIAAIPTEILTYGEPHPSGAARTILAPTAYFFDADRIADVEVRGCAIATRVVDLLANKSGSYDPQSHGTLTLPSKDAEAYRAEIGNQYRDSIGIWCRALIPIHTAYLAGIKALIENKALIDAMRESRALTNRPMDLRIVEAAKSSNDSFAIHSYR